MYLICLKVAALITDVLVKTKSSVHVLFIESSENEIDQQENPLLWKAFVDFQHDDTH